jgi:hypothetical protein
LLDYGKPINHSSITITPQTSSALLSSYTEALNLAGLLDCTLSGSGIVITSVAAGTHSVQAVAFQPDGKIVVAGSARGEFTQSFAIARYTSTGALYTTFGTGEGTTVTPLGAGATAYALNVQSNNTLVVGIC